MGALFVSFRSFGKRTFIRSPPFEKGGQGGFEAFLNPPKSPFPKGGLASHSPLWSVQLSCIGSKAQMNTVSKHCYFEKHIMLYQFNTPKSVITRK